MKRGLLTGLLLILFLLVIACTRAPPATEEPLALPAEPAPSEELPPAVKEEVETAPEQVLPQETKKVVEITSSGFNPKTLNINAGETVTFVNKDSSAHWPASNLHPTHMAYPSSSIEKCGTEEESTTFDACGNLEPGEEYSFTFTRVGRWPYHDHLHPNRGGTIAVR